MDNFLQDGEVVEVLAGADVVAGEGHQVGEIFGVCAGDALSGAKVRLKRKGVFNLPNLTTDVTTVGAKLYWDAADGETTLLPDTATNKLIGFALSAAGNGVTTVECLLTCEASV
jgi:predicted RecA/RadA family phage recombinase